MWIYNKPVILFSKDRTKLRKWVGGSSGKIFGKIFCCFVLLDMLQKKLIGGEWIGCGQSEFFSDQSIFVNWQDPLRRKSTNKNNRPYDLHLSPRDSLSGIICETVGYIQYNNIQRGSTYIRCILYVKKPQYYYRLGTRPCYDVETTSQQGRVPSGV